MEVDWIVKDHEISECLSSLTVAVMTYNRPSMLENVIRYWSKWPVSILVLDGSDRPFDASAFESSPATISVYAENSINERLKYAAAMVDTPFVCLHTDDDFTLARTVAGAIAWLKKNERYTCVSGDFQLFDGRGGFGLAPAGANLDSSDPGDRVRSHLSNYQWSYVYGVQRTEQFSTTISAVLEAMTHPDFVDNPNDCAHELGMEICGALQGCVSRSSEVLILRRIGNESESSNQVPSDVWLQARDSRLAAKAWRESLSAAIAPSIGATNAQVNEWIQGALDDFCLSVETRRRARPWQERFVSWFAHVIRPSASRSSSVFAPRSIRYRQNVQGYVYRSLRNSYRMLRGRDNHPSFELPDGIYATRAHRQDLEEIMKLCGPRLSQ